MTKSQLHKCAEQQGTAAIAEKKKSLNPTANAKQNRNVSQAASLMCQLIQRKQNNLLHL